MGKKKDYYSSYDWTLKFNQTMAIVSIFVILFEFMQLLVCMIFFFPEEASLVPLVNGFLESLQSLTLNPNTPQLS